MCRLNGLGLTTLSILCICAVGCGLGFNAASGEDAKRGGAIAIEANMAIDDQVSTALGDDTDWKSFELQGDANVRIRIWWDDPEVEAMVTLYNQRARMIAEILHEEDTAMDELEPMREEGTLPPHEVSLLPKLLQDGKCVCSTDFGEE